MFLIAQRHEILADTPIAFPYMGKQLYDLCAYRQHHSNKLTKRIRLQVALTGILITSLLENVARFFLYFAALSCIVDQEKWRKGFEFSILTTVFCFYALFWNLFVKNLSSSLIDFDLSLRSYRSDEFLFEACEAGRRDLSWMLLRRKEVNPHKILQADASAVLVPQLVGYPRLNSLFVRNAYERDYLHLKRFTHWLSLKGTINLHGHEIPLGGIPPRWTFQEIARVFQRFRESKDFNKIALSHKHAQELKEALNFAYLEHDYQKISTRIRKKKLCFVASGWKSHGVCLAFLGNYMAISNRGEKPKNQTTLEVYKIDPQKITSSLIEEILMHQELPRKKGEEFFYKILPKKISFTHHCEKDSLCKSFQTIAPKISKADVCSLHSKTGALRFAWAMFFTKNPNEKSLQKARRESKIFTDWAAIQAFDQNRLITDKEILSEAKKNRDRKWFRLKWNQFRQGLVF